MLMLRLPSSTLGRCYSRGPAVRKHNFKAYDLFLAAANAGDAGAQNELGVCYYKGLGLKQDLYRSAQHFKRPSSAENANGQINLGICYRERGIPKSLSKALNAYRLAGKSGNAYTQICMAWCYETGCGIGRDRVEALRLYSLAAAKGDSRAQIGASRSE